MLQTQAAVGSGDGSTDSRIHGSCLIDQSEGEVKQ
jgi:hypothetical protein